jgi:hypothetical protein
MGAGGKSIHKRFHFGETQPVWPGAFIGLRGAIGTGLDRFPGVSTANVETTGSNAFHLAPYVGAEFGATAHKFGGSIVLEGTGLAVPPSDSSPILGHVMLTAQGMYVYSPRIRIVVGYSLLNYMHVTSTAGNVTGDADLKGPGFRFGAHFRITQPVAARNWEWFLYGLINRMTDETFIIQSKDAAGKTTTLADSGGNRVGGSNWLIYGGGQLNFNW